MSTAATATHDGRADQLLRRQQGRARPALRRVGRERADRRGRRRRRRDGPGRARPRPRHLPGAGQARPPARRRTASTRADALPMLRDELPDWASMIAANLVIDGILTTWIASARDSSIEPLAQRARKILQEEGAHKVHAEAWCQAHLPPGRRRPRAAAARGSARRGSRPRAGPGPTTTPATARRSRRACSPAGPARCAPRCATGWRRCSRPRAARSSCRSPQWVSVTCPFCESPDVEDVAQWGGQIITRQVRCRSCNTYFEAVRDDFDDPPDERRLRPAGRHASPRPRGA